MGAEYGHNHAVVSLPDGGCAVDWWGGDALKIEIAGRFILFEFSDRFGPMPTTKRGMERKMGPHDPFWRAVSLWKLQGRRTENGVAIWHEPKKPVYETKHLGGRNYLITRVIEAGEPGHDW